MHHAYYQGLMDVSDGEGLKLLHHSSGVLGSTYWHTIIQVQSAKNQQQLGHWQLQRRILGTIANSVCVGHL